MNDQNPSPTMRYDVEAALAAISEIAVRTPLLSSSALTEGIDTPVTLKLENLQVTGSFKVRGAANKILSLSEDEKERGVVTCSSGNHGLAVSYVAGSLGIPATVVEELGLTYVHPFDDPYVVAGQGTIGLELLEQLPSMDSVVVPLSGGGLIGGIAYAVKTADPAIRVIGVSAENARVMYESLKLGHPAAFPEDDTVASALSGGIGLDNEHTFGLVRDYVDEHVLVTEDEIKDAMVFAAKEHKLVVEGGGAVGVAAVLAEKIDRECNSIAVVVSGGNIEMRSFAQIVSGQNGE
jgi:threonine dehydratase